MFGRLETLPAREHPELLAAPVEAALSAASFEAYVAAIDPELADTAALCDAYDVPLEVSANCVVVTGRRGGEERHAACVVQATARADVNGVVRRRLDARKASFADREFATAATRMEFGGITPLGLPADWPVWVDPGVVALPWIVIGSGVRGSKLVVPGVALTTLPQAVVVDGLGRPVG
ncbi:MAG: hypothetical protein GEU93_19780 [Propionibacteriales bacterium]|nr:hypothetical protein [Propionibacteriales bacterium]